MLQSYSTVQSKLRHPVRTTLISHVLLASVHINTNYAQNLLLLDILQYSFAAAITQWEFCMEAKADIFLEQIAFDNV